MVSNWILSKNKRSQVSRTLLSILADLSNAVVWVVATHPVISKSTSPCTNRLVTVHRATIIILPIGWVCRIHRLHLCRGVRPLPNECPVYDTRHSDGEVPVMLEIWEMRCTPLLPSLPGPLLPGVVAPDRALSMG